MRSVMAVFGGPPRPLVRHALFSGNAAARRPLEALDLAIREPGPRPCGLKQPGKAQRRAGFTNIGRPPNRLRSRPLPNAHWMQANNYLMVPPARIERARAEIPRQDDD